MTQTLTTQGEIRSARNGRVPEVDSPAMSTRARARIPVTQSEIKKGDRISRAVSGWWGLHVRPLSTAEAWTLSRLDKARIPSDSALIRALWAVSNWTDRLIMFAVIQVAPTFVQAPLRWIACRPTRRYGFYLTVSALTALYHFGRK